MARVKVALAWAALLIFAGLSGAAAATKMSILYYPGGGYTPLFVAKDQGFFAKHQLDVDLTQVVNQSTVIPALQAGTVQLAPTTMLGLLQAVQAGIDLTAIAGSAVSTPTSHLSSVIVRRDSKINGPKDLAGKTIAVPGLNEYFHILTRRWLKNQGVDVKQVKFVEISLPVMGDALKAGTVDAVLTLQPFSDRIVDTDGRVLIYFDSTLPADTLTTVYATTRDWANANKDAVAAVRASLDEGVAFMKSNDAAARASVAKYLKLPPEVVGKMTFPRIKDQLVPSQIDFWINLAKDDGLLPATSTISTQSLLFP